MILKEPNNWQELEVLSYQLFSEIGCQCERQKSLESSRGSVIVDLYAQDFVSDPPLVYICECKHWNSRIPKQVVHSFRTVVLDTGVNRGYLISKKGFQSGSYDAAKNTNIELVSWAQLQDLFKPRWIQAMNNHLDQLLLKFNDHVNKLGNYKFPDGSEISKEELFNLFEKYTSGFVYWCFGTRNLVSEEKFPICLSHYSNPEESISISSVREYFDIAIPLIESIISTVENILARKQL